DFYRFWLSRAEYPALEIGCGTGRLLIPYIKEGFTISGLDSSISMLDICKKKAQSFGIEPTLYLQDMQTLSLHSSYGIIFLPSCVFMNIADPQVAEHTLKLFYKSLKPQGILLVSLNIPEFNQEPLVWRIQRHVHAEQIAATIVCSQAVSYRFYSQIKQILYKYELYRDMILEQTELVEQSLRWYGAWEIKSMLEKAGFNDIQFFGDYTFEPASDHHELFIIKAQKGKNNG
ncbi:MAG TPA: methyltransferase domain-containing protein, partial [Candidatus Babeliaceae bacterium]|nr:methyltransferase domain-containing protein [Candidatus Babeliaceae bacterium]